MDTELRRYHVDQYQQQLRAAAHNERLARGGQDGRIGVIATVPVRGRLEALREVFGTMSTVRLVEPPADDRPRLGIRL